MDVFALRVCLATPTMYQVVRLTLTSEKLNINFTLMMHLRSNYLLFIIKSLGTAYLLESHWRENLIVFFCVCENVAMFCLSCVHWKAQGVPQ